MYSQTRAELSQHMHDITWCVPNCSYVKFKYIFQFLTPNKKLFTGVDLTGEWPTRPQASDVMWAYGVVQQNDSLTAEKHSNLQVSFYKVSPQIYHCQSKQQTISYNLPAYQS